MSTTIGMPGIRDARAMMLQPGTDPLPNPSHDCPAETPVLASASCAPNSGAHGFESGPGTFSDSSSFFAGPRERAALSKSQHPNPGAGPRLLAAWRTSPV